MCVLLCLWTTLYSISNGHLCAGGWSANGQPVDQLHHVYRRLLASSDAKWLGYEHDLRGRKNFEDLTLLPNGQAKKKVNFVDVLHSSVDAWEKVPLVYFKSAWTVCGYVNAENAEALQAAATAAAEELDPSGFGRLLGVQLDALPPTPQTEKWTWCVERPTGWESIPAEISIAIQKRVAQFTRTRADLLEPQCRSCRV